VVRGSKAIKSTGERKGIPHPDIINRHNGAIEMMKKSLAGGNFRNVMFLGLLRKWCVNQRDPSTSFVICLQGSLNTVVGRWQITHSVQDDIFKFFFNSSFLLVILAALLFASMVGCSNRAPLKIQELSYVMPGDIVGDYDVYRVIAVKENVTKQELVGLMEYFTQLYLDKNRVMIYVFDMPGAPYTGETKHLVATYFHDKAKQQYDREILIDQPQSTF
jgi:hypothetical protein